MVVNTDTSAARNRTVSILRSRRMRLRLCFSLAPASDDGGMVLEARPGTADMVRKSRF